VSDRDRLSEDVQRYLDGEHVGHLDAAERAHADSLLAAIEAYAARLEEPGSELDGAVMRAVRARPAPLARVSLWRWLLQPRVVRVRPALAAAAAVALLVVGALGVSLQRTGTVVAAPHAESVLVRFELRAPGAAQVTLAGSFNDWDPGGIELVRSPETGLWVGTVPLSPGEHEYLFVIDGSRWIPDPSAHAQVDDGFGAANSVIVVGPRGVVRS
jgi:hypothetical protein